jgi:hypothetical protein
LNIYTQKSLKTTNNIVESKFVTYLTTYFLPLSIWKIGLHIGRIGYTASIEKYLLNFKKMFSKENTCRKLIEVCAT